MSAPDTGHTLDSPAEGAAVASPMPAGLQFAMDALQEGFVLYGADGRLVACNRTMRVQFPHVAEMLKPGLRAEDMFRRVAELRFAGRPDADREEWLAQRIADHRDCSGRVVEREIQGRLYHVCERKSPDGQTLITYHDVDTLRAHESEKAREAAKLQAILDNLAQGLVVINADLYIVASNDRAAELLALPEISLRPGADYREVIRICAARGDFGPGDLQAVVDRVVARARSQISSTFERKLASGRMLNVRVAPVPGVGKVITLTDITEHRSAEMALAHQQALFETIFRLIPESLILTDAENRVVTCNPATARIFGRSLDGMIGRPIAAFLGAAGLGEDSGAEAGGGMREVRFRRGDGEEIVTESTSVPLDFSEDRALGAVHIVRDITRRKRAEHQLHMTQHSINRVSDCALWLRSDGAIADVNDTTCRVLGYPRDRLARTAVFDIFSELTPAQWERIWARAKAGGTFTKQINLKTSDDRLIPAEISASLIEFDGSQYLCAFARDVTERMASEERLRQSQKMEALGQLAGGVAHEFNNVLTSVMGFTRLALKRPDDVERVKECLTEVLDASQRASDLTKQMLTFGRKQVLETKTVRAGGVVRGLEKLLRTLIEETIVFDWRIADDRVCIDVDQTQFSQSVINLAINARHAMPDGGRLTLGVERVSNAGARIMSHGDILEPGAYVRVSVGDTGSGIDKVVLQHIFEPFFTTKKAGKGTGLGLSLVYGMVRNAGGIIDVASEIGKGTTFSLYLPAVDGPPSEDGEAEVTTSDLPAGNQTVLLAEDDPGIRRFLSHSLETQGYRVLLAQNGAVALETFRREQAHIDIVVSDVMMPEMDGLALAKALQAIQPEVRIIFITGYAPELTDKLAKLTEGVTLLKKPFEPETLIRLIVDKLAAVPCKPSAVA